MGQSIHEHLGEASVRHHFDRVEYPAKRLFSGTGATSLNYYTTHPIQTPEHLFYGMSPASIPGRGAAQLQSLVHGAGANGVGISFPPPRPGSLCLVAEPGRGRLVSLGELRSHGAEGEIGLDQTDRNGNLVRSSSHLAIPVSYNDNGLSVVTSIPRPGLNNPLSGSPLFTELPANIQFTSFTNATDYSLNIGSSHRLNRSEPRASIGSASNGTAALEAQASQFITASDYEDFLSGADGTFFFTDPTQQVPTVYPAITSDPDNSQSALAEEKAKEEAYLNQLDQMLRLPLAQEQFRAETYTRLHTQSIAAWQNTRSHRRSLTQPGFLNEITDFIKQINQYLPTALGVVKFVKGLTDGDANTVETESYAIDPQTLTLTPTLRAELRLINRYLTGDNLLTYNYQTKVLTLAGRKFYVGRRPQLDEDYINKLQTLNKYFPRNVAFKIYRQRNAITSIKVFPGVFIEADSGLVVPEVIDPVGRSLARLHCYLPPNIYSALAAKAIRNPGKAPSITTSLDFKNSAQANKLLQELIRLVGEFSEGDLVFVALKQVNQYLPADLRGLLTYTPEDGLKFNASRAIESGLNSINKQLPSWMKLGAKFDGGNISGFNLGPLSLDFSNGVDFSVDFEQLLKLTGVLELLDSIAELPIDSRELKGLIQSVRYPHDRLSNRNRTRESLGTAGSITSATTSAKSVSPEVQGVERNLKDHQKYFPYAQFSDDSLTTINTGGNLEVRSTPELNIDAYPGGSPFPILLVTSELLSNVQSVVDAILAKPQSTDTGRSPVTGKRYLPKASKAYCVGQEIPLLDISAGASYIPIPTLPSPQRQSSGATLTTMLANSGLGVSAAPLVSSLDRLVKPNFRPEQIAATDFLNTLAAASNNQAVQQALIGASVSLGEPASKFVEQIRSQQQKQQPACGDLADFSINLSDLDGSQDALSSLLNTLEVPDMLLSSVLHSQAYLRDWLEQIDPPLVPAMEYLAKGDLFYFLVELIYYRTGRDILRSPQKALRLKQLVHSRYKLAAPGFSLLDELLHD